MTSGVYTAAYTAAWGVGGQSPGAKSQGRSLPLATGLKCAPASLTRLHSRPPCHPPPASVLGYPGEPLDTALQRFVVARKSKLDAVLAMLRGHLAWFSEQQVASLRGLSAASVLEVAPEAVNAVDSAFPHYHAGHDKDGRPVTYIHGCSYSAATLFSLVPPDRVARYHTWRTERMLGGMYARLQAGSAPLPTGQLAVVIDLAGMTMRHVDKQFLGLIKLLAVVDQAHYPERLGKMYICGVSRIFFVVWRMVRPWLDARTASKICFLTSDEVDAGALLDSIDAQQLPIAYGGAAPNPWDRGPTAEEDSLPGYAALSATGDPTSAAFASLADAGRVTPPPGPAARPPSHRRGGSGWSNAGSGSSPAKGLPPIAGSAAHHGPHHSRSTSADFALAQRRLGGGHHHRRTPSDDATSVASFLSAGGSSMHDYESDTEFLDAVDAYVELRMGEVSEGGDAKTPLSPDATVIAEVSKVLAHSGDAPPDGDASAGGHMHPHLPHAPPTRTQHTATPQPGRPPASRGRSSTPTAGSGQKAGPAGRPPPLPPIPEVVIKEVKGRLNRVRLLLDCTNVLTLITSIVLLSLNDTGTSKLTGGPLRAFGGVIMSVSLVSLLGGVTMVWSAGSICFACRYLFRGKAAVVEEPEGEEAV